VLLFNQANANEKSVGSVMTVVVFLMFVHTACPV